MNFLKKFGQFPNASKKAYFDTLSNYKLGKFQNEIHTPAIAEGQSMGKLLIEFFQKKPHTEPSVPIPFINTDLNMLPRDENVFIWFGHSSYFIQVDGLKFLIDPVFSGKASPVPGTVKAFPGTNHYQAEHFPEIDFLLISHDHWDHLDADTIAALQPKVKQVICGLGVSQHFEYWGWPLEKITAKNWHESVALKPGFSITLTPARHFSGRWFTRNISLWTSYVLQTPSFKLFLGGDSGYGPHFKVIGEKYGPFDWAILECGQYNQKWPYIHSMPHELIQEMQDLNASKLIPVHHSKFKLALHPWFEPLENVTNCAEEKGVHTFTPMIGESLSLNATEVHTSRWWKAIMPPVL